MNELPEESDRPKLRFQLITTTHILREGLETTSIYQYQWRSLKNDVYSIEIRACKRMISPRLLLHVSCYNIKLDNRTRENILALFYEHFSRQDVSTKYIDGIPHFTI